MPWPDETGVFNRSGPLKVSCTAGVSAHKRVTRLFAAEQRCAVVWVAVMQASSDYSPTFCVLPSLQHLPIAHVKEDHAHTGFMWLAPKDSSHPVFVCAVTQHLVPALLGEIFRVKCLQNAPMKCCPDPGLVLLQVVMSFYMDPALFGSYYKGSQGDKGSDL